MISKNDKVRLPIKKITELKLLKFCQTGIEILHKLIKTMLKFNASFLHCPIGKLRKSQGQYHEQRKVKMLELIITHLQEFQLCHR